MSKIYIENGSYIVELEDYDGSSITNMRVAEASAPNTWYTFGSVDLEAPNPSYDGAYIGTHDHKFVGFGANEAAWAGNNFIIFTPTGLADGQSITTDSLLLPSDWSYLINQTGFVATDVKSELVYHFKGHWSFDSDATDSANGYNGTVTAGSFESDVGRDFISFERESTGIVSLPDSLDSIVAGDYTMSAWVRLDTIQDTDFGYFGVMTIDGVGLSVTLGYPSITSNGGDTTHHFSGVGLMSVDTWYHLVLVQEGSDKKLYLDGVLLGTNPTQPSASWGIGTDNNVAKGYSPFDGDIDDLRIYSMALDASQVSDLYTATTVTPTPLTDDLTSKYVLGADVADSQGNYDGTNSGVTFANDATLGRDVAVFAAGDYFEIPKGLENGITSSYTISMWLNPDALQGSLQTLFMDGQSGSTYSALSSYILDDGRLVVWHGPANSASGRQSLESTAVLPVGSWTHVTFSWDGSDMSIYYDGVLDNSGAMTAIPWDNIHPLRVGEYRTTAGYSFIGKMADFRFWTDRSLSASEVATLYGAGAESFSTPATPIQKNGYYPLYEDESDANGHAGGDGSSHSHVFDGVTYHMPNGLAMGVTQFHGNYGLIAKYVLDDNSDDSVGTNNLSLTGGSVSYVGYGTNQAAVEFNFGELESDDVVDLTGEFTISFWAKEGTPHVYYSNNYSSFFKWGTSTGSYFDLYLLNGKIRTMHNNAAAGWGDNRGSVAVPAGWNHYAMTIDPSTGSKIVYLNGVAQTLTGPAFTGTFASSQKVYLGNVSNDSAFRSNGGQMDDVRIWDRVLEASEIATIAAEGADETTAVAEELIGHWNFDNGDLSAVVGSAGTNDGASFVTLTDRTAVSIPKGVFSPLQAGGRVRWDNGGFDFTTEDFSVALWIYNTPSSASWPQTIGNLSFGNSAEPYGWSFGKYDTSETLFSAQSADGTANGWSNTHLQQFEIPLYKWTHVVLTRVGTEFKVYLNGADSGYTGVAHSSIVHQSGDDFMTLGMSTDETWSASSGVYDDIRVYNYALDASEASSLYSSTLVATPSGDSVDVNVFSSDTYGDGWNNGQVEVRDANGNQVQVFTGPASGLIHPTGVSETMSLIAGGAYTAIVSPGGYPSEMYSSFSDEDGVLLASVNGSSGTIAFIAPAAQADPPSSDLTPTVEMLGGITSLSSQISLPATFTINVWVRDTYLDGTRPYANLFQQVSGAAYVLDAASGIIGSHPERLTFDAAAPLRVAGTWHMVSVTYDGTDYEYFANGSSIGSVTPSNPATVIDNINSGVNANEEFAAYVKDLRIYEGVRSSQEILDSYSTQGVIVVSESSESSSGTYDWTHGGQLTNIVKFSRGTDIDGNPSYAYAKKADNGTVTLYLATDFTDFATFTSYDVSATSFVGAPVCMEYGSDGQLVLGTDAGKVYGIGVNTNSDPLGQFAEMHSMAYGEKINSLKFDAINNEWIFEAGEKVHTIDNSNGIVAERYTLPAGAKIVDIASGDSGVAMIIRRADFSLTPVIATAGWSEISDETAMVASLNSLGVADFNYDYAIDKWIAASADGQVLQADDLLQFLGGGGSPPLPG